MGATIYVPTLQKPGWIADLSDGRRFKQNDMNDGMSPWLTLKQMCYKNRLQIVSLAIVFGKATLSIDGIRNIIGFWQANKMRMGSNLEANYAADPDWHWYGIGFVNPDHVVHIQWLSSPNTPWFNDLPGQTQYIYEKPGTPPIAIAAYERRMSVTEKAAIIWNDPTLAEDHRLVISK